MAEQDLNIGKLWVGALVILPVIAIAAGVKWVSRRPAVQPISTLGQASTPAPMVSQATPSLPQLPAAGPKTEPAAPDDIPDPTPADIDWQTKNLFTPDFVSVPIEIDGPKSTVHFRLKFWAELTGTGRKSAIDDAAMYEKLRFGAKHLTVLDENGDHIGGGLRPRAFWTEDEKARQRKVYPDIKRLLWSARLMPDDGPKWVWCPGSEMGRDGIVLVHRLGWEEFSKADQRAAYFAIREYKSIYFGWAGRVSVVSIEDGEKLADDDWFERGQPAP